MPGERCAYSKHEGKTKSGPSSHADHSEVAHAAAAGLGRPGCNDQDTKRAKGNRKRRQGGRVATTRADRARAFLCLPLFTAARTGRGSAAAAAALSFASLGHRAARPKSAAQARSSGRVMRKTMGEAPLPPPPIRYPPRTGTNCTYPDKGRAAAGSAVNRLSPPFY